jgi:hypothetical protein
MGPLNGEDWPSIFNNYDGSFDILNLDQKASNHINGFWEHYGLKLDYNVEHKPELKKSIRFF